MQHAIELRSRIAKERLNPYQYTLSLLREGLRVGLLTERAVRDIQAQIMLILQDLIVRYTHGESTSVKTETAESLLNSIFYALDAYANAADPGACLDRLQAGGVREAYERGLELVIACVAEARAIYQEVRRNKLDVPLEVYHTSIDEALPGFFLQYNVIFQAHDTTCMLDYPLVFDDMKVQGVYYIRRYLETLRTETEFCRLFGSDEVRGLLARYGAVYRIDVATSPVNLYEIVLSNALFATLVGNPAGQLAITQGQYERLRVQLRSLASGDLAVLIEVALEEMIDGLGLGIAAPEVVAYIWRTKPLLLQRIVTAVEHNSLHNVAITDEDEPVREERIDFVSGARMSDAEFRALAGQVAACTQVAEKVRTVLEQVISFRDFVDLLEADCFYGEEYLALYAGLGELELALLCRVVLEEELRLAPLPLAVWSSELAPEREWQVQYVVFLRSRNAELLQALAERVAVLGC